MSGSKLPISKTTRKTITSTWLKYGNYFGNLILSDNLARRSWRIQLRNRNALGCVSGIEVTEVFPARRDVWVTTVLLSAADFWNRIFFLLSLSVTSRHRRRL